MAKEKTLHLSEEQMQFLSVGLSHMIWRNTVAEDLHAEGAIMDDNTMMILNKEINNRIYTLLNMYFNGTAEDRQHLSDALQFGYECGIHWDKAELLPKERF